MSFFQNFLEGCPTVDCMTLKKDPVCGSDQKTYPNECELKRTACEIGEDSNLVAISKGQCYIPPTPPPRYIWFQLSNKCIQITKFK